MGCQCCRMIKSYIYDPSALGEPGKGESSVSGSRGSLYQPRSHHPGPGGPQKEGVSNPAYTKSNEGTLKLEAERNHVNLLPAQQQAQQQGASAPAGGGGGALYIIQPQAPGPRWTTEMDTHRPSLVPVYPDPLDYGGGPPGYRSGDAAGWDTLVGAADDEDEGVGGTPEYPCDTGDEASVLSAEMRTASTASVSSADAPRWPAGAADTATAESGISGMKSEDDDEEEEQERRRRRKAEKEEEDVRSVTDSMVAEALAAMEAATAGEEDFE